MIKVETPVEEYIKEVLTLGAAHHLIPVQGDVVDQLERTAKLMRIESVFIK
jgi:L-arabinose isomerase